VSINRNVNSIYKIEIEAGRTQRVKRNAIPKGSGAPAHHVLVLWTLDASILRQNHKYSWGKRFENPKKGDWNSDPT